MPEQVVLKVGSILVNEKGTQYRIIGMKDGIVALCEMNTGDLRLTWKKDADVDSNVRKNNWSIQSGTAHQVFDTHTFSDKIRTDYEIKRDAVYKIRDHYGPLYNHLKHDRINHYAQKIITEYGLNAAVFWRIVRKWLQSGFDDMSLIDARVIRYQKDEYEMVNGRVKVIEHANHQKLSKEDISNIEKYLKEYRAHTYKSLRSAYIEMCNECYRERRVENDATIFEPLKNQPSYFQFFRYCKKQLTQEEKDAIHMKPNQQRNNKRLLKSSSMTGVTYPGHTVEIDEVDNPVYLVSEQDPENTVGRPNTYMMIDVKTRVILAIGVAYNQNAYVGLSNLFINLAEDKVEYCKKYNIMIQPEEWPSCIIPARARADRGADFKGEDFRNVCMKVGIERDLEPPATGSLKGIIENSFNNIQKDERDLYEGIGLITHEYDSDHHRKAMLNLYEYTKVLILLVLKHNKRYMTKYPMSKELVANNIKPIPYVLWEYYSRTVQAPMPIQNKEAFLIALMKDGRASIDRQGIHFMKRTYIPADDEADLLEKMYQQQSHKAYIDIKYDPRIMNRIYLPRNGRLIVLNMSHNKPENDGYFDLSEQEIAYYNKQANEMRKKGEKYNLQVDAATQLHAKTAIRDAFKKTLPSDKNLRENRHAEKSTAAQENYGLADYLGIAQDDSQAQIPEQAEPEISEEALNMPAPEKKDDDADDDLLQQFIDAQGK